MGGALTSPVVVTGGAGLLGRAVADTFSRKGAEVHALGHAELDVTDADAVRSTIANISPDVVVHCAAMTDVDACEREPDRARVVNSVGSGNVAAAADAAGAVVVAISTDYVFDGDRGSYREDDETNPIQSYGRSKLEGERLVREAARRHFVLRSAWIYGHGGKNFLSKLPHLARTNERINAVADQYGSPTYAVDLADAIALVCATDAYGTYHVVNDGTCSFAEFCEYAVEVLEAGLAVDHVEMESLDRPAARPRNGTLVPAAWTEAGFPILRHWRDAARAFLTEPTTT